jgi:hypothetical protein
MTGMAGPVTRDTATQPHGWSRRLAIALLALMIGGMFGSIPFAATPAAAGDIGTVIADGAPLLAGVDDDTIIDYMAYGTPVDILYGPHNGKFEILYNGVHGWTWVDKIDAGGVVWSETVEETANEPSTVSWWSEPSSVVIDTDALNVRADAGAWAGVIDVYEGGTWVQVVGDSVNGYAPIAYGDGVAWVAEQYLSWNGETTWDTGASDAGVGGSAASAPADEHWIDVDRSSGLVTLYIGDVPQAQYWGSLGYDASDDGFFSTAIGTWYVTRKYKDLAWTNWANAYITDWVAFDESRANGFHSYMKDANGNILPNGAGRTGGCVSLGPEGAAAVYDFAYVGMRVEVHW